MSRSHGRSGTAEYKRWKDIKKRCFNANAKMFKHYGGRGISICPRWRDSFTDYWNDILAEIGPRPLGLSLDRINNDGNYEPGNVRWATRQLQARNTRNPRAVIRSDGKFYEYMADAAADVGTSCGNIHNVCSGRGRTLGGYGWRFAAPRTERRAA